MIIAQRKLTLTQNGRATIVPISIYAPKKRDSWWMCRFEIGWPDGTASRWGEGADAMQALFIAMQMIGAEIYASAYHDSKQLSWLAPERGYGFPVSKNIRDLLIGDDQKFL